MTRNRERGRRRAPAVTALPWQTGLKVAVEKVLSVCLAPEGLRARPMLHGELRVRGKEFPSFDPGLLHSSKLRQARSQNTLRPHPVGCLVPKRSDRIFVATCRILGEAEKPVIPAGRIGVESESLAE